jgi:hypothetical protein
MARPSRPLEEAAAVREAAAAILTEMPSASWPTVARKIARKVAEATVSDIDHDDPLSVALAALEQRLLPSPITTLATSEEIDTVAMFTERRVSRLRARSGKYLTPREQTVERAGIISEITEVLTRRYLRHIRC